MYLHTLITWRRVNDDGSVSAHAHAIPDKERAADTVKELALTPGVFALRFVQEGEDPSEDDEAGDVEFHTRIGPPVTG